jgi:hypothetical protein
MDIFLKILMKAPLPSPITGLSPETSAPGRRRYGGRLGPKSDIQVKLM